MSFASGTYILWDAERISCEWRIYVFRLKDVKNISVEISIAGVYFTKKRMSVRYWNKHPFRIGEGLFEIF